MKSTEQCLAEALKLEQMAARASSDETRKMLLRAAATWRKLPDDAVEAPRITPHKTS
jgi:hypothetical protein